MNKSNSIAAELFPRKYPLCRKLHLLGPLVEDYVLWLYNLRYSKHTISYQLRAMVLLEQWLKKCHVVELKQIEEHLGDECCFLAREKRRTWKCLCTFLVERSIIKRPACPISPGQQAALDFGDYLRRMRGFVELTVLMHIGRVRAFLDFLGCDGNPSVCARISIKDVDAFIQEKAKVNNRFTLQHVVATLRAYLRFLYSKGVLAKPLHEQIEAPRIYHLEKLPLTISPEQVRALLQSINRDTSAGRRDFTILYLASAYGLRCGEIVRLKLEDIDWRRGVLRIFQTKNRQFMELPLTDEAGDVLVDYIRRRPTSRLRELFLRQQAPVGTISGVAIYRILKDRIRLSGIKLPNVSPHALRHTFAVTMLQRGIGIKSIGDMLGHRDMRSTSVYLRLNVEDLRQAALPVPRCDAAPVLFPRGKRPVAPRIYNYKPSSSRIDFFRSGFAESLNSYVELKRALGRNYSTEKRRLLQWDTFLYQNHGKRKYFGRGEFDLWVGSFTNQSQSTRLKHLRDVRSFLRFYGRDHSDVFIPDLSFFPKAPPVPTPMIVTSAEMASILALADQLPSGRCNPLRARTMKLALTLLFCCGLRLGELQRLKLKHLDTPQKFLRVEMTKFYKTRMVPFTESVLSEIQLYLKLRRRSGIPMGEDSFFIWHPRGTKHAMTTRSISYAWQQLCLMSHIVDRRGRPPRLHDLRHSFAVNALHRWYVRGEDVQTKIHFLSTYLGHVDIRSTHRYLHLTPQLSEEASERFHRHFVSFLKKGGVA